MAKYFVKSGNPELKLQGANSNRSLLLHSNNSRGCIVSTTLVLLAVLFLIFTDFLLSSHFNLKIKTMF